MELLKPIVSKKVVLVTGASSGIGLEVAKQFALNGARLAILSSSASNIEKAADQIGHLTEVLAVHADVSHKDEIEIALKKVLDKWGRIDVLVSNAGMLVYGLVEDCNITDFEHQIAVNYLGAVYLTKVILPEMLKQKSGSLIYVSSISGRIYLPYNAAYQASKAALRAFVLTLRREVKDKGIKVSLISPGRTKTKIRQVSDVRTKPSGQPILGEMPSERVAKVIVRCSERPSREIILPWVLKPTLFVYNIFPDILEIWLPRIQTYWRKILFRGKVDDGRLT